jgi:hypothetical protein
MLLHVSADSHRSSSRAERELAAVLEVLENGREGASREWLDAVLQYVELLRRAVHDQKGSSDVQDAAPFGPWRGFPHGDDTRSRLH